VVTVFFLSRNFLLIDNAHESILKAKTDSFPTTTDFFCSHQRQSEQFCIAASEKPNSKVEKNTNSFQFLSIFIFN
jgi:hypothetical protein